MAHNVSNSDWAPRLPTEIIEQHLEQYFPDHDIDSLRPSRQISQVIQPVFRWVRGELIGKGTYSRVYLAMNTTTGDIITAKQVEIPQKVDSNVSPSSETDAGVLMRESEILQDLDHPHIVQYLGYEETPSMSSLFLEYVPGGSVSHYLRTGGRFDDIVSKSFAAQILSGLEYLHAQGIVHRNLKSDNILVDPNGVCKISNFGFAKHADDTSTIASSTSMAGSAYWVAPEVLNTNGQGLTPKIDIWSLGCVVFEMWTGRRPWSEQQVVPNPPPLPADVTLSASGEEFRTKCFAVDPINRSTAAELRKHAYLELPPGWAFETFY
ncbi:kinase-like domain-containing protein [Daedaleopsis nitida]|nr:kinase-like domain-containing protein [Daedaleopsis nitida]